MKDYQAKVETISKLLLERASVYPVRDINYERLIAELQVFAEDLLADVDLNEIEYEQNLISAAVELIEHPVFICGSMKSGTTLLCRLLDSHPDLLAVPADLYFYRLINRWDKTQFKEVVIYWIQRLVNPSGLEPFWFFGKQEETFKVFISYLDYFINRLGKNPMYSAVMTFYILNALLSSAWTPKKYWIEKTPHNEVDAQKIAKLFPNAKFIHILRDPLSNIVSLKKLDMYMNWKGSALDHARVIRKLFGSAKSNVEVLGENRYLIVKYEDLVKDPSAIMHRISGFLNISFNEILLTPTENGLPAVSNSMFPQERVKGKISDLGQNKRYLKDLTQDELRDIVTTLYSDALEAGYQWDLKEIVQFKKMRPSYLFYDFVEFIGGIFTKLRSAKKP